MPLNVREDAFGKYIIRSGQVSGAWQARAFRGKQAVGQVHIAASQAEAVEAAKAMLTERETRLKDGRGPDGSPSALEYAEAFDRLGRLPPAYEAMLDAHLNALDHLITASQLAEAAGYANWSAANLHYGRLARRLAEEMNYDPPKREDGSPMWTYALATSAGEGDLDEVQLFAALERGLDEPHFEWLLRRQVIEALQGSQREKP